MTIWWTDGDEPQSPAPKHLNKPTKIEMPLPKNGLAKWLTGFVPRVSQCEAHSFDNTMQWKQLEVYEWGGEYGDRCTAHILQFRVKNL